MKRPFWPLLLIVMKTPTSPEVIVVSHSRKTTVFCLFGILLKVGTWITWQLELGVFLGIGSWNLVFFLGSAVGTSCFFWDRQLELGVFFGIGSWNLVFFLESAVGTWCFFWDRQLELGVFFGIGSWNLVFFLGSAVGTWCFFWDRQLELGVFFGIIFESDIPICGPSWPKSCGSRAQKFSI